MSESSYKFGTRTIHAGTDPDPATGARITPIYQTASYVFDDADHASKLFGLEAFGNIYTRITNPTTGALEARVADLEGGTAALAVASGHAAQLLVFHTLMQSGDEFIASKKLYGGSINQFGHGFKSFGWNVKWADSLEPQDFEAQITPKTKAIFVESLANPTGAIVDIKALSEIARRHHIPLIVDNTMATPYLCNPIALGANIVVHSLTKFLGGHGNSIGGIIVDGGNFDWLKNDHYPALSQAREEYNGMILGESFGTMAFSIAARVLGLRDLGPAISPFNAFLILNGIETLALRMERHCQNAQAVAEFLEQNEGVAWVSYAGLPSSPFHALQQAMLPKGAGSVFTFGLKGGYEAGVKFVDSLKMFSHVANIGDTRSLVIHPASTTHKQLNTAQKASAGASDETVRVSIGIEDVDDIIADLKQAIELSRTA